MRSPAVIVRQSFAPLPRGRQLKAFSSEVVSGSRQENASNQKDRTLGSDFTRAEVEIVWRGEGGSLDFTSRCRAVTPVPELPLGVEHKI
jgi:hypothetical protein